jgi:hypothetical protein
VEAKAICKAQVMASMTINTLGNMVTTRLLLTKGKWIFNFSKLARYQKRLK